MGMNVKSLRHHGSAITPPPPVESPSPVSEVLVRYYVDGVTPTDTIADGTQTFPYPDGPFRFIVLNSDGSNPPPLDWVFNTDNGQLFATLLAEVVNLGGGLTTASRLNLRYAVPNGYRGSTFEAQAYEQDPIFPLSRTFGPLLSFACDPELHAPVYISPWIIERYSRNSGFHILTSGEPNPAANTFPSAWATAEVVQQGNSILLPFPGQQWGTLSRLVWSVEQLSGPMGRVIFTDSSFVDVFWQIQPTYLGGGPDNNNTSYKDAIRLALDANPTKTLLTTQAFRHFYPLGFSYNNFGTTQYLDPSAGLYPLGFRDRSDYLGAVPAIDRPYSGVYGARGPNVEEWSSMWFDDTGPALELYQPFICFERWAVGMNYTGCTYRVRAYFQNVQVGTDILLTCES